MSFLPFSVPIFAELTAFTSFGTVLLSPNTTAPVRLSVADDATVTLLPNTNAWSACTVLLLPNA